MGRTTYLGPGWELCCADWQHSIGTTKPEWLDAQVPGHVHLDLVRHGIIADPFERMNEIGCQWVDGQDWSYRARFQWSADEALPRRILRFEGLDTVCEIFLNGERVASSDNMFVPLEVDASELLREGQNELRIDFRSAVKVGLERKEAYFRQESLPETTGRFDDRAFVRKAQYMFGWDWGPRLVSCGIWKPVSLLEFASRITDVHVRQRHSANGVVELRVDTEFEGPGTPVHVLSSGAAIPEGAWTSIDSPVLWEPGSPVRYVLTTKLESNGALDEKRTAIGFARIELIQEPDRFGESFEFSVNGKRIWARGANWIPDHSFPSVVSRERLLAQIKRAADMGYNMLRVWGGGLYESDDFYDLCDEHGILVWQDFPFACSYYPDDEPAQRELRREAEANIRRLRNHPSLALWCGNNENLVMFVSKWGGADTNPDYYYGENLYDHVLPEAVRELDEGRSYIPSSPMGAAPDDSGKKPKYGNPNVDGYGDQHMWDVWHGRGDWRYYEDSATRFSSEFGFAASCSTSMWAQNLDEEDWSPHSPTVRWHDKTGKGEEKFHSYVELHYPAAQTLEDWVYTSQLNQRDALRFGIEHWRRSEYCKGTLVWQMNDCWPVQSWAMVDFDGNYKASAYESRRLYADLLASLTRNNDSFALWGVNDGHEPVEAQAKLAAYDVRTGERKRESSVEVCLAPGERKILLETSASGLAAPETIVVGAVGAARCWQLLAEPKAMRLSEPAPILLSTAGPGMLRLRTTAPVVDLMLTSQGSTLPFRDNFVTLESAGTFEVRLAQGAPYLEARSLAGVHPLEVTRSPI